MERGSRLLTRPRCPTLMPSHRHRWSIQFFRCASNNRTAQHEAPALGRSYEDAVQRLYTLQSNRAVLSYLAHDRQKRYANAIPEMIEWLRKTGYEVEDLNQNGIRYIHVAGTKGKGSVCAMIENILLQYQGKEVGKSGGLGKIGLYTSPHLVHVRERVQIDGAPISESMFCHYFFEIWDRLSAAATAEQTSPSSPISDTPPMPMFFRYMTLVALHAFIQEGVQTAIIECGIGGEYDSTNILPASAVTTTAITRLGIDHVGSLGSTIESIAWHKAGIMKSGVPVFTVPQQLPAQAVLESRATEKNTSVTTVPRLPILDVDNIKLGLDGDFQKDNASLAVAVAASHLNTLSTPVSLDSIPAEFVRGLETTKHLGRCQIVNDGNIQWYLDGAHSEDSITETAIWFRKKLAEAKTSSQHPTTTVLIYAAQGLDRDPKYLLRRLMNTFLTDTPMLKESSKAADSVLGVSHDINDTLPLAYDVVAGQKTVFTYASFCTMDITARHHDSMPPDEQNRLDELARVYQNIERNAMNVVSNSIESAMAMARRVAEGEDRVMVLVTGSLHLVGGVLSVLEKRQTPAQQEK